MRPVKPLEFPGDSKKRLKAFPEEVQYRFGFALYQAQQGGRHINAKPFDGHIEVVEDFDTDTFRAVYTVRLEGCVYVLHCFKKKSKSGIATPSADVELVRERFKEAQRRHKERRAANKWNETRE